MSEPRYRPIARLAAGGMAEVFIAEATSVQGFKKKVAIKRVLPHLASNRNFLGMFLDEARLGARMSHANCVSVFDIGAADDTYFLVMEFVEGCDLKTVVEYFAKRGKPVPLNLAIFIMMEACHGLAYAHELTDDDGHPLNIVHRDISPPNILISKRGEVKVTDFGLAKASTQLEKTDPGVVKGKYAYLSPEAVSGEEVDARADVFAAATVLWEMVSGQRLFLGNTDFETVKMVGAARVPSLVGVVAGVDAEFDALLQKALARDRDKRFQSATDFGEALAEYLFAHRLKVTGHDLAKVIGQAIAAADAAKPKQSAVASLIDQFIQEELMRFTSLDPSRDTKQPHREHDGATPLDAGQFVNPGDWLDGEELGSAFEGGESGWKESGLLDSTDSTLPSFPLSGEGTPVSTSLPPVSGEDSAVTAKPAKEPPKSSAPVFFAVVAVAAVVGAALAFLR